MKKIAIKQLDELEDRVPAAALVADVDLVIVRYDDSVSVLYGRCAHRGALDGGRPCRWRQSDLRGARLGLSARSGHQRIQQQRDAAKVRCLGRGGQGLG